MAQQHHEDEDHREQDAVDHLREEHDADQRQARYQNDHRRHAEEEGEQPVERRCLPGPEVEATLQPKSFGGRVGACQRDDAESEERGAEQAEREDFFGGMTGEGPSAFAAAAASESTFPRAPRASPPRR